MARPKGYRLSRAAFLDLARAKHLSMSEIAALGGMPLTTLSGLVNGDHGASMRTVRKLADGLGCEPETLFPELAFPAAVA
jgi:transcriptional regulator with XRE-family HTH domain